MEEKYKNNLDIFEVESPYYKSYEYCCKNRQLMKITPIHTTEKQLIAWRDIETGLLLYGKEITNITGMDATRYFIFEYLSEDLLGPELTTRHIKVDEETYIKLIKHMTEKQNG